MHTPADYSGERESGVSHRGISGRCVPPAGSCGVVDGRRAAKRSRPSCGDLRETADFSAFRALTTRDGRTLTGRLKRRVYPPDGRVHNRLAASSRWMSRLDTSLMYAKLKIKREVDTLCRGPRKQHLNVHVTRYM